MASKFDGVECGIGAICSCLISQVYLSFWFVRFSFSTSSVGCWVECAAAHRILSIHSLSNTFATTMLELFHTTNRYYNLTILFIIYQSKFEI